MNMSMATRFLRAHHTLPDGWSVYKFSAQDDGSVLVWGATSIELESGRLAWDHGATNRQFTVRPSEVDLWHENQGMCALCENTGRVWAGWDHMSGNWYRLCTCGHAVNGETPLTRERLSHEHTNPVRNHPLPRRAARLCAGSHLREARR